jgi:hypothetical protein
MIRDWKTPLFTFPTPEVVLSADDVQKWLSSFDIDEFCQILFKMMLSNKYLYTKIKNFIDRNPL